MSATKTETPPGEDSAAKKARLMGAIKAPEPPELPSFSRGFAPKPTLAPADTPTSAAKAPSQGASKPNFSAMRKRAEKRDPVAGKSLTDDEMIQMTHYLTARERREFKILTVINGHSMNEVIRHAVSEYITLHREKLPR